MTDLHDYQRQAQRTDATRNEPADWRMMIAALGLAGEAGEVAEIIKKYMAQGHPLDTGKLYTELGDILWYLAAMCAAMQIELADVAAANIEKLQRRYPYGFDRERSQRRDG